MTAALYECVVTHQRIVPIRHRFRYRTYQWLVDLDDLPRLPWPFRLLSRFEAHDHFGTPVSTIRNGVENFLAGHKIDATACKILMLANPRVFGYVFNPLSVYWCLQPNGKMECVVAEVHNTYGGRHCYLLPPTDSDRVTIPKAFYVSPFFPVDGTYELHVPRPGDRLNVGITLRRGGTLAFAARITGRRTPLRIHNLLMLSVRYPWHTAATIVRIRFQGVVLLLRGLRRYPRTTPAEHIPRADNTEIA